MRNKAILLVGMLLVTTGGGAFAQKGPLQGGIETKQQGTSLDGGADNSYPAPAMVQPLIPQKAAPAKPVKVKPFKMNATESAPAPVQQSVPLQANVQKAVALPQGFLGTWMVNGQRTKVEAMPEFQAGAEQAFSMNTNNTWNINGAPGNYQMSNGQMSTAIYVDKVQGGTAFIRYQHPIKNTMAQEAIVMSLTPGGMQFNGLERISIVKEGSPQPRAKVTYQLSGSRQR